MKKGFTIIELLAVIVILAIVWLITIPMILNTINIAREKSAKQSAMGYIEAVEKQQVINKLSNKGEIVDKEYTIEELTNLGVKIKGEQPSDGTVIIENGIVKMAYLKVGYYNIEYKDGIVKILSRNSKLIGRVKLSKNYTQLIPSKTEIVEIENISDGELSCETSDNSIATCSIENNKMTIIAGTEEGTATITVISKETKKYTEGKAAFAVITSKPLLSYTVTGYEGIYDELEHGITVISSDATIKYGIEEGTYNLDESPKYKDVGEYTIYYEITKEGYKTAKGSKTVKITKAEGNLSIPSTNGEVLVDKSISVTVTSTGEIGCETSDASIATCSAKNKVVTITGVSQGETTIKIKTISTNYTEASKDYSITVKAPRKANEIAAGNNHNLVIDDEGILWAFGYNGYGQLGNNSTKNSLVPVKIKEETKFKAIAAGDNHSLAIDEDGNLWAFGYNGYGQLGNNSTASSLVPVQIKAGTKFKSVSAGDNHSLAIDEDGNLWAFGYNRYDQLGNNSTSDSKVPIQIKAGTKFKSISAGNGSSLVIDENGNCWGFGNTYNYFDQYRIIQIKAGTKFKSISAGANFNMHFFAIDEIGNLWAWGNNGSGQLGNNSSIIVDKSAPVQIKAGTKFKGISAGKQHSLAIDESGNLWTWGSNDSGQLGNNSTSSSLSPIHINF